MTSNPLRSDKGIALILVISVIAALVVSGVMLNRQVRGMIVSSATQADHLKLSEMCRSGLEAAVLRLGAGKTEDVLGWILSEENRAELAEDINNALAFSSDTLDVTVADERALIQVNALIDYPHRGQFNAEQRQLWERLLRILKAQSPDGPEFTEAEIIDALIDWLDAGDDDAITGLSGAESDYYEGLPVPYSAANAPMQHIGELLLIKGMSPELYHGTPELPGLARYVTAAGVFGKSAAGLRFDGKININTAEATVIAAILPLEYQSLAEAIVAYRQERIAEKDFETLKQPAWYKNAPGCGNLELPPDLVTVYSNLFRVTMTAFSGNRRVHRTALVQCQREDTPAAKRCEILRYE
ncbi:MAG: general secretion pathway protein GspK [Pseudomonadota bacterium]